MNNLVKCYLCGNEATVQEMAFSITPALGHYADHAMACAWFCPDTCFERLFTQTKEHSKWEMGKEQSVYVWQDRRCEEARACVRECSEEDLCEMENLPEGLKITPADRARLAELRDKLEDVTQLQDYEDNALLYRVCRNRNKTPFLHPQTKEFVDYETLKSNFETLERLTPEEIRRLN